MEVGEGRGAWPGFWVGRPEGRVCHWWWWSGGSCRQQQEPSHHSVGNVSLQELGIWNMHTPCTGKLRLEQPTNEAFEPRMNTMSL